MSKITVEAPSSDAMLESYKCLMSVAREARHLDAWKVQNVPEEEDIAVNAKIVTPVLAVAEEVWNRLSPEQQAQLEPPWAESANGLLPDPHWDSEAYV